MIFQNINFVDQTPVDDDVMKICRNHPECKGCPLKTKDMNIQGTTITCVAGKNS